MKRARIERRLRQISQQIKNLRDDIGQTEEQSRQLEDEADNARIRALVSETPLAEREHRQADRHSERLRRHRERSLERLRELQVEQDQLLDRLSSL